MKWSLDENIDKAKVVVFIKRGGLKGMIFFINHGKQIDFVENFNYLGTTFILEYTGSVHLNHE